MSYYYDDQEPDYEKEWLRKCFGEDWVEGDDPYREAFDGHPGAYWNID